jgi:2-polyprenyl-6-methoxyphenol hydroxylase-like FAD-dependent oxidoreductase
MYSHGVAPTAISRKNLTQLLYDSLPSSIKSGSLHANKRVDTITTSDSGVTVTCTDGSTYTGSTVIGADGAHSRVRAQMRSLALEQGTPEADLNEELPYLTTFRCLWIRFPTEMGLKGGDCYEVHGTGAAIQVFAGEDTCVAGLYETLDKPTRERLRFTQADQDAIIEKWGHLPISNSGLTLKAAYTNQLEAGMVSLEEGVVRHWSDGKGRMVLVGDAKHKFTPSTGQGCNHGIADVVVLVNRLHRLLSSSASSLEQQQERRNPTGEELQAVFSRYQEDRHEDVVKTCEGSGTATSTATWSTFMKWFMDKYVLSMVWFQRHYADGAVAAKMARIPVLDFVEGEEEIKGRVPYINLIKPVAIKAA